MLLEQLCVPVLVLWAASKPSNLLLTSAIRGGGAVTQCSCAISVTGVSQGWGLTTVVGLSNSVKLLLPSSVPQH